MSYDRVPLAWVVLVARDSGVAVSRSVVVAVGALASALASGCASASEGHTTGIPAGDVTGMDTGYILLTCHC